jgi:phospholipase/lecithinase/hemolysin
MLSEEIVMRRLQSGLAAIFLAVTSCFPASAASFSSLYVFGDSLVDAGNLRIGTGGEQARPQDGYFSGRYSNGYNFADYLALDIGAAIPAPSLSGGTNFAVGGAKAQRSSGEIIPSFLGQIDYLSTSARPTIAGDALVLVEFGGNDVRDTIGYGGDVVFADAVADYSRGLALLYGLGARNFLIVGAPDVGLMPDSAKVTGNNPVRLGELSERSANLSSLFSAEADDLDSLPGTNVTFFDLVDFEHRLLLDPTAFGLPGTIDATTPCQIKEGGSPQLANCSNSIYFDTVHPTTLTHRAIATAIGGQLTAVPEVASWELMIFGFGVVGALLRRRAVVLADTGGVMAMPAKS